MNTYISLQIYFAINIFLAGNEYGATYNSYGNKEQKIDVLMKVLGILFFGVVVILFAILYSILDMIMYKIEEFTQIKFLIALYLSDKWSNLNKEDVKIMVAKAESKKNIKTFKSKMYVFAVNKLIEKYPI